MLVRRAAARTARERGRLARGGDLRQQVHRRPQPQTRLITVRLLRTPQVCPLSAGPAARSDRRETARGGRQSRDLLDERVSSLNGFL